MKKTKTIEDQYKELIGPGRWTVISFRFGCESDARQFHFDVMDALPSRYALFDLSVTVATLIVREDDEDAVSIAGDTAGRNFGKMREYYPKIMKN